LADAAISRQPAQQYATALRQGSAGARGAFADTLNGLTAALYAQLRSAVDRHEVSRARAVCRAIVDVEHAKDGLARNINPQLVTGQLIRTMASAFEGQL
jgi:hypothetical protein